MNHTSKEPEVPSVTPNEAAERAAEKFSIEAAEGRAVAAMSEATALALREAMGKLAEDEDGVHWVRVIGEYYFEGRLEADIARDMNISLKTMQRYRLKGEMALGSLLGIVKRSRPEGT